MLSGKVAVVTGGSGVLGASFSQALVSAGADVAVLGQSLESASKGAKFAGDGSLAVACDVKSYDSLRMAKEKINSIFGAIDILINCAGGNHPAASTGPDRSFFEVEESALLELIDLNFLGTVRASQIFGKDIADKKSGNIVNISSMAAIRPVTRGLGYGASKAAVTQFTQWLAVHMAQNYSPEIRVNAIAPGFFLTEQNRFLLQNESGGPTARSLSITVHTPQNRLGEPSELQSTLLWLLDPKSKFVTGAVVPVDGGFSAYSGV